VSSSANSSLPGQSVSFTVDLSAVPPGAGTPTGLVQFKIDGANAGSPVVLSGGSASFSTSALALGLHTVIAEYAGDGNFAGTTNTLVPAQLVNTPPVAGPDAIERDPTNSVKVSVATLLSNDSDPDSDPISFLGVDLISAGSGTITTNGDWILYTPNAGFTNADSFAYQISDGRGSPVTGTVAVNVRLDNGPSPNLTITSLGNGSYRIHFDGVPGRTYHIQRSESLDSPDWITVGSATADQIGAFEFIASPPVGSALGYYRSIYP
jgi:hypothetical protein